MRRRSRLRVCDYSQSAGLYPGDIDLSTWPEIDRAALSPERETLYARRERAIRLYLDGATDTQLKTGCGMGRVQTYRLLTERCLASHPDGDVHGWRGLLPYVRVKSYDRKPPIKPDAWGGRAAGALQWVFESPAGRGFESRLRELLLWRL